MRTISRVVNAVRTLEGAGFEVRRPFPTHGLREFDPFLLLDEMGPADLGPGEARGAPDHPHRGFETVTYMIAGEMEHRDSQGNHGRLGPGDVQWMTAGSGIVHSEMPSAEILRHGGRTHGFQLWVNLPAKDKMMRPRYQELPADGIPSAESPDGKVRVKVIAGEALGARAAIDTRTPIVYLHFSLEPGGEIVQKVTRGWNAFAYVFNGSVVAAAESRPVHDGQAVVFEDDGDEIRLAMPEDASPPTELLLLAGVPLREPVVRHGPFVMNTESEIMQAVEDFRTGRLGSIPAAR